MDTVASCVQWSSGYRSLQAKCWRLSSGTKMESCSWTTWKNVQSSWKSTILHFSTNLNSNLSPNFLASFRNDSCFFKKMKIITKQPLRTIKWQIFIVKLWIITIWLLLLPPLTNFKERLKGRKFSSAEEATLLRTDGLQHKDTSSWMD
jgi:hypothetical protein